jgi:hypothetical protein
MVRWWWWCAAFLGSCQKGKETTYITNLFKQANIKIAFRTRDSILNHLANHTHTHTTKATPPQEGTNSHALIARKPTLARQAELLNKV